MTIQTLAGNLARYTPKIYTIKSQTTEMTNITINDDTTVFWLHDLVKFHGLQFDETYIHDHLGLLKRFASNITGFVVYDPSTQSTNAALIRCAAEDGVVAAGTAAMVDYLQNTLKLPMVANVSASNPAVEFKRSKAKLSNRAMVAQPNDGSKSNCKYKRALDKRRDETTNAECCCFLFPFAFISTGTFYFTPPSAVIYTYIHRYTIHTYCAMHLLISFYFGVAALHFFKRLKRVRPTMSMTHPLRFQFSDGVR